MNKKQKMIASIVVYVIGLLIASSIIFSGDTFSQPQAEVMKIISNAFLIPGVLFAGVGALMFVSNMGYFGIFDYGFKQLNISFGSKEKRKEFRDKYPDYFTFNNERSKEQAQFTFILVPGIIFLLLSLLFTVLFFYI
jgi:hypothetical protein